MSCGESRRRSTLPGYAGIRGSRSDLEEVTAAFLFCPLFGQAANGTPDETGRGRRPPLGAGPTGGRSLRNQLARCLTRPAAGGQPDDDPAPLVLFRGRGCGQVAGWRAVKVA